MADATEKSALSLLVESAAGTATETITSGLMGTLGNLVLGALGISGSEFDDIAEQLNRIEDLENQILDEIGDISDEIKTAVDVSQMTDAEATIKGNYDKMKSIITDMNPDKGMASEDLVGDYNTLADDVYESIPTAIQQIDLHALDFLNDLLQKKREDRTEILKYNITLCQAISRICRTFGIAKDLMEFSLAAHPTLDNVVDDAQKMIQKICDWKMQNVTGSTTEMVAALVDKNTKSYRISTPVACYGDTNVTTPGDNDGSYWMSVNDRNVTCSPMSKDDKTEKMAEKRGGIEAFTERALIVHKADDFNLLDNADLQLEFEGIDDYVGVTPTAVWGPAIGERCLMVDNEWYDDGDDVWQFRCCASNTISQRELRHTFCIHHNNTHQYITAIGGLAIIRDASNDNTQQYWSIVF